MWHITEERILCNLWPQMPLNLLCEARSHSYIWLNASAAGDQKCIKLALGGAATSGWPLCNEYQAGLPWQLGLSSLSEA